MDRAIYDEINVMNVSYGFHFLLYIVMSLLHFFSYWKLYWMSKTSLYIFITFSVIDCLLLFYPILPLVLTYRILSKIKLTKIFRNISFIFIFISAGIGLLLSIFLWINIKNSPLFFKECPYNYPSTENDFQKLVNKIQNAKDEKKQNKLCTTRRCFLQSQNDEEIYAYNYICNFDSSDDFLIELNKIYTKTTPLGNQLESENLIQCKKFNITTEDLEKMDIDKYQKQFYNFCNNKYESLYKCERFEKPEILNLKNNYNCPKKNYVTVSYLFGVFTIITDIILTFIPWSFDYTSYKEIVRVTEQDNNSNNDSQSQENNRNISNNVTGQNSNSGNSNSVVSNVLNLNTNKNEEFVQTPTETIILVPSNENKKLNKERNNSVEDNIQNITIKKGNKKKEQNNKNENNKIVTKKIFKKPIENENLKSQKKNKIFGMKKTYFDDDSHKDLKNTTMNNYGNQKYYNKISLNEINCKNDNYSTGRIKHKMKHATIKKNINYLNENNYIPCIDIQNNDENLNVNHEVKKSENLKSLKSDMKTRAGSTSGNKRSDGLSRGTISGDLSKLTNRRMAAISNLKSRKSKRMIIFSHMANLETDIQNKPID